MPESWNMGLGGFVLGSPIFYLKGMRIGFPLRVLEEALL